MQKKRARSAFSMFELSIVILIIAVVVSAILGAQSLIKKARIQNARNLTQSSAVNSIKNIEIWLESSLEESFFAVESDDGHALSQWININPLKASKSNAIQTDGDAKPEYSNTINSIHTVKFDGSSNLTIDGSSLNNSDYTIHVVEKRTSSDSDNYFIGDPDDVTENESLLLGYSANNAVIHSQGGDNSYTAPINTYSSAEPRIFTFVQRASEGKKIYINGILAASDNDVNKVSGLSNIEIGKSYVGEIGEVIVASRAMNSEELQSSIDYLSKKWKIDSNYGASCTNGSVVSGECDVNICSISKVGSSTTEVDEGSGNITCNQTGYSGTVAYTCSDGSLSSSDTCSCDSGYTLVSGTCQQDCSISITGSSTSSVTAGSSTISCNQTGYTGTASYTCSGGSITSSGTCSCASGYSLVSGSCQPDDCSVSITGISTPSTVSSGTGSLTCNTTGYTGTVNYSCSAGSLSVTSGSCSCASGYTLVSGSCLPDCSVSVTGVSTPTSVSSGTGSLSCNATGYNSSDSVSYSCSSGSLSVTSGACDSCASGYTLVSGTCQADCSVSVTGVSSPSSVSAGSGSLTCNASGYSGTVSYTCSSGSLSVTGSCTAASSGWIVYSTTGCGGTGGSYVSAGTTIVCNSTNNGLRVWANSRYTGGTPTTNDLYVSANSAVYRWLTQGCTEDGPGGSKSCYGGYSHCSPGYGATIYECNY